MYYSFMVVLALATLFTFINKRYLKFQLTIGLMILGIAMSLVIAATKYFAPEFVTNIPHFVQDINFNKFLMNGILSFLLFAGSIHIDMKELKAEKISVFMFALIGTLISTFLIGTMMYYFFNMLGLVQISYLYCLLFGALISPTDPIAVLAIFKDYNVNKILTIKVEGESLFNDGIGIVIFVTILNLIQGSNAGFSVGDTMMLFLREAVGGIAFGLALGWLAVKIIKSQKNDVNNNIMVTLVVVTGGYAIANWLEVSGALSMVAAGLFIGNYINNKANQKLKDFMSNFWGIVDAVFNSTLFVLMGLSILLIDATVIDYRAAIVIIVIGLISRYISVAIPYAILDENRYNFPFFNAKTVAVMTWSGLRGALAFALALSVGNTENGHFFIFLTYCVVAFSIIVQGLSIPYLIKKWKI